MENKIEIGPKYYTKYKDEMISLYIEAFYNNDSNEKLRSDVGVYFDRIFDCGFGLFSISDKQLNGVLLVTPPTFDKHMPTEISKVIDPKKTQYIAEVFVGKTHRGKGYGKQLFNAFFETIDKAYDTFIIRVLTNNAPAIKLYEAYSFEPKTTMVEEKIDFKQNKTALEKLYLIRKE